MPERRLATCYVAELVSSQRRFGRAARDQGRGGPELYATRRDLLAELNRHAPWPRSCQIETELVWLGCFEADGEARRGRYRFEVVRLRRLRFVVAYLTRPPPGAWHPWVCHTLEPWPPGPGRFDLF